MFDLCFLFYFITGCRLGDSNVCSLEDGLKANSHVKSLNMDVHFFLVLSCFIVLLAMKLVIPEDLHWQKFSR